MGTVTLDVGGTTFVTLRTTLMESDSFFSGAARGGDDHIFVDRDPTHFRHILNWMRGSRVLPQEEQTVRELECEANYYAMHDMCEALAASPRTPSAASATCRVSEQLQKLRDEVRRHG